MLPTPDPAVIFKDLPEGAVLFNPTQEVYFGLNAVGAVIWGLLPPACDSLDQLCAAVRLRYPDVDPATIRVDVQELLDSLAANGLVVARARDASGAESR